MFAPGDVVVVLTSPTTKAVGTVVRPMRLNEQGGIGVPRDFDRVFEVRLWGDRTQRERVMVCYPDDLAIP